jgi:hypothetical protein
MKLRYTHNIKFSVGLGCFVGEETPTKAKFKDINFLSAVP